MLTPLVAFEIFGGGEGISEHDDLIQMASLTMTDVGTIEDEANKDDDHISLGLDEEEQAEGGGGHDEDNGLDTQRRKRVMRMEIG